MTGAVRHAFMAGTGTTSPALYDNVGISGCVVVGK